MKRHWLIAVTAAFATLAVIGGFTYAARRGGPARGADEAGAPATAAPSTRPSDPAALVVRDGDTVEASGTVVLVPGRPPRLCAPAPVTADLPADRPRTCTMGVDVAGFDAGRLGPDGRVRLRGALRGGVLHVTEQGPGVPEPSVDFDWRVPCPPPAGGWTGGRGDDNALHELVHDEHPEWYRELRVTYPDGEPGSSTDGPQPRTVFVVEIVTADRDAAERAVRARYSGDLCIVARPGAKSLADQQRDFERVQAVASPLMRDPANGIYSMSGGDLVEIEMVMLTPQLQERLGPVLPLILANPWLRPVR
jgi:hypothetical protein